MSAPATETTSPPIERPRLDADIVCVGFGPATAGFLSKVSSALLNADGTPALESSVAPGLPPQVLCYERADDIGFGVSGVVTKAKALRESFPHLDDAAIPMMTGVTEEQVVYLLDPIGASRRSRTLRIADAFIEGFEWGLPVEHHALTLPWTPGFLHKQGGLILSLGQFTQWVGAKIQETGTVQIWPGTPVSEALLREDAVIGVRLTDQGVDSDGNPGSGFTPGMDIHAGLTVVGDGPVGAVGRQLDEEFGLPHQHHTREWAIGMKFVVDLPEHSTLKTGMVLHTFGYPEPEIFGFCYVHPDRVASLGIFVPSWFDNPVRTTYRYLQHWMLHPYLWRHLNGGKLRSWGAKTLGESGRRGEPLLVGNGYARIGEGSGTTNVLTGSGVDEAWASGTQLGEAVLELLRQKKPFTKENLQKSYVERRRASWLEHESLVAKKSRDGFQSGVVSGMMGMALTGLTGGRLAFPGKSRRPWERIPSLEEYYRSKIPTDEIRQIRDACYARGVSAHAALMERAGWPSIPYDGRLLISHQDALLLGGKVQAPAGYADHVVFSYPDQCRTCGTKLCVEACSGQAITPGDHGVPRFDREKCVHCGACLWNCASASPDDSENGSLAFRAGPGGLHSAEN